MIKRIEDPKLRPNPKQIQKMKELGNSYLGKNYDLFFEWSNDRIYCTELVWKLYKEIPNLQVGTLKTLNDFDLSSPQVKSLMNKRYGNHIPKDEPVISPSDMFDSNILMEVMRSN
ncbi:YiiX/YebB-like N1pC/P60 family cysteine hydrolase [Leptospira sp. 96542]|nr:YiiX/YebB-like N1pC/P60 family cysteine hydrolase [Leptospira sp. 96542]